jgi:hypothetical protein
MGLKMDVVITSVDPVGVGFRRFDSEQVPK